MKEPRFQELFDSDILINALDDRHEAVMTIQQSVDPAISVVTWIEVMVGARLREETRTRRFLDGFSHLEISREVMERSVRIRQTTRLKLPDAIILATAQVHGKVLVTRNTKTFLTGQRASLCLTGLPESQRFSISSPVRVGKEKQCRNAHWEKAIWKFPLLAWDVWV